MNAGEEKLEVWQTVWRKGLAPHLPLKGLEALREALITDSQELIQCETLVTTSEVSGQGYPTEKTVGCCGVLYPFWKGGVASNPVALRVYFSDVISKCCNTFIDHGWKLPNASDNFIKWFDLTSRTKMRMELLPEVELELERRKNL